MHVSHRCLGRGAAGSGRTDDNEESLRKRFVTYEEATMPIIRLNSTYMLIMTEDWRVISENTVHFRHSGCHVSDVWSIDHWCNKLLTVHFTIFQELWKVEPGSPTGCNQVSGWSFCGGGKDHLRLQVRGSCWNSQPWLVNHSTSNQLTPKISCISVLIWKLSFCKSPLILSYSIQYNFFGCWCSGCSMLKLSWCLERCGWWQYIFVLFWEVIKLTFAWLYTMCNAHLHI